MDLGTLNYSPNEDGSKRVLNQQSIGRMIRKYRSVRKQGKYLEHSR